MRRFARSAPLPGSLLSHGVLRTPTSRLAPPRSFSASSLRDTLFSERQRLADGPLASYGLIASSPDKSPDAKLAAAREIVALLCTQSGAAAEAVLPAVRAAVKKAGDDPTDAVERYEGMLKELRGDLEAVFERVEAKDGGKALDKAVEKLSWMVKTLAGLEAGDILPVLEKSGADLTALGKAYREAESKVPSRPHPHVPAFFYRHPDLLKTVEKMLKARDDEREKRVVGDKI
ncbi:hypothetical protein DFJ74DRAFT_705674 [Hyaloraphidium curvatum]|nr:hypothetical protein DFJ74DRAFT_705674 [Hyaloraphidium curvatum]